MKIAVIGGTGLIGSKLVTKLREQGYEAVAASPDSGVNTLTGEGLADVLKRAAAVVDVSNSPSFDEEVAMNFFNTATRNLIQYDLAAGVRHHVALSVNAPQQSCQGGNTRSALFFDSFPIYISRSWGATVEDVDGHAYLDVLGEFTAGLYGHSDEQLAKAMSDTLGRGISNGEPSSAEIELAEWSAAAFPELKKSAFVIPARRPIAHFGGAVNLAQNFVEIFAQARAVFIPVRGHSVAHESWTVLAPVYLMAARPTPIASSGSESVCAQPGAEFSEALVVAHLRFVSQHSAPW